MRFTLTHVGASSIWSVDSTESLLSPSIGSEMAFSPAANTVEWKPPVRKPSLPVNLTAPTHCLILKNIPHHVRSVINTCSLTFCLEITMYMYIIITNYLKCTCQSINTHNVE